MGNIDNKNIYGKANLDADGVSAGYKQAIHDNKTAVTTFEIYEEYLLCITF